LVHQQQFGVPDTSQNTGNNTINIPFKGTVSQDIFALVFFLNQLILVLLEMP
jgi:hypothetical protein